MIVLAVTSLGAATVNGALGYGYSSISVPIALLVVAGRVLNPALVIVEVAINLYALCWNRARRGRVLGRVLPLAVGLVPGVDRRRVAARPRRAGEREARACTSCCCR